MTNSMARAWLGTLIANGFILLCNIATGIFSARLLLPEGRGSLAIVLFWPQVIGSFCLLNLDTAIAQRASQPDVNIRQLSATGIYLALILSSVTTLIVYPLLPYIIGSERLEWLPLVRSYLVVFLPFNFLGLALVAIDHGAFRIVSYNLFKLVPYLIYLFGLIILWSTHQITVSNLIWANWAGTFVVAVARFFSVRGLGLSPSVEQAKDLFLTGCHLMSASIPIAIAAQMDRIVIMGLLDESVVGLYTVAFTFANSGLSAIVASFQTIIFPKLAGENNIAEQRKILGKGLRYIMLTTTLGSLFLMSLAPWLIPFIFGSEFRSATFPAILLLIAYIPSGLRLFIINSLYGLNLPQPIAFNSILVSCSFFPIAWILNIIFGLEGIIFSLLIANSIGLLHLSQYLYQQLGLVGKDWWGLNRQTLTQVISLSIALTRKSSSVSR